MKKIANMRDRVKASFYHSKKWKVFLIMVKLECKLDENKINENPWIKNVKKN